MTILIIVLAFLLLCKLFLKVDRTMTYCGIFAFSGVKNITKEQLEKAVTKMKILGIYNESRGGDGTGVFIDNQIIKCGEKNKNFPNFIESFPLPTPETNNIVLGHCRKRSRGMISTEHTHPFLINEDLVGIHNGTIENIFDLKREHKIDTGTNYNDSFGLYSVIEQQGPEVLSEYKGYAALIWTRLSDENSLWVFRGASRSTKDGNILDERPLYYMITEEGLYFSSLQCSLWAIREGDKQMPDELPANMVIKVTNGKFVASSKITIERENANVIVPYNYQGNFQGGAGRNTRPSEDVDDDYADGWGDYMEGLRPNTYAYSQHRSNTPPSAAPSAQGAKVGQTYRERHHGVQLSIPDTGISSKTEHEPTVWRETLPKRLMENKEAVRIYFHKGRFYVHPGQLCAGEMLIMKGGYIIEGTNNIKTANKYYFYQGVMCKSKQAYDDLLGAILEEKIPINNPMANFALYLSKYSAYPVTNLPSESVDVKPVDRFKWYFNQMTQGENFTPPYCTRHYIISKSGYLTAIKNVQKRCKEETLHPDFKTANLAIEARMGGNATNIAPFQEIDKKITEERKNDHRKKDPIFDRIYTNAKDIFLMPKAYFDAIICFIDERWKEENSLDADSFEIQNEIKTYFHTAVSAQITLRDALKDDSFILDKYVIMNTEVDDDYRKDDGPDYDGDSTAIIDSYNHSQTPVKHDSLKDLKKFLDTFHAPTMDDDDDSFDDVLAADDNKRRTEDTLEDVTNLLSELTDRVEDLGRIEGQFAGDAGSKLKQFLEQAKYNLAQVAEDNSSEEIVQKINSAINL